jgi:hypothetical protein
MEEYKTAWKTSHITKAKQQAAVVNRLYDYAHDKQAATYDVCGQGHSTCRATACRGHHTFGSVFEPNCSSGSRFFENRLHKHAKNLSHIQAEKYYIFLLFNFFL